MVIAPEKVEAYLRAKGISPRLTDAQWAAAIAVLAPHFQNGRWYQVKILHQPEDPLRRFSSLFPDSIPTPYRFIDYIRFAAGGSGPEPAIVTDLTAHGIPFTATTEPNGPEEGDVVTVIRVGPQQP